MKTIIIFSTLLIILNPFCKAQIIQDYPFKTYLDSENNLYVTGYQQQGNTKDVYTAKYPPIPNSNPIWFNTHFNPFGDDRGLDLAVDQKGNTYVTGYFNNSSTDSNDIIVIKYDTGGVYKWDRIYSNSGDDRGMGIDITINEDGLASEVYISGYVTSPNTGKDFIIKKYNPSNGDSHWQHIYNNNSGDDAATEILLDDRFAYIAGYTYQNGYPHSDIMLLVYDMDEDSLVNTVVFNKPGSNEKPSEFIFTYYSTDRRQKSRCAVASVTDEIVFNNPTTKYLTLYFAPDLQQNMKVKWSKTLTNGPLSRTNVATSIAADALGDVYVSGYMFNYDNATQSNGLDFATVKYNRFDGSFGW
ncbi:MAG: hypothetical protein M3R36_09240, partial [Bacteroidota bacterium]|nr:hypothetical protein [Bacteroidota bacterium]